MSGIRLPDCSKLVVNWKHSNDVIIFLKLWQFFFYKGLIRNPEIRNNSVWVWINIAKLGQARNTKFSTKVSNKMLLNAAKCQGYIFYRFSVIKGKPTRAVKYPTHHPPRLALRLRGFLYSILAYSFFLGYLESSSIFLDIKC